MPPPAPKPDNQIDANEAKLIGDFFVTVGKELSGANADLRTNVLKAADQGNVDYYWIDGATAEYKMNMTVGVKQDGLGRKRESEVVLKADFKRASAATQMAPFNVLFGVIAPAERDRDQVMLLLKTWFPGVAAGEHSPIFHLGGQKYWVIAKDGTEYYVVEFGSPGKVTLVTTLQELTENLKGMFTFLSEQLKQTHSGS